MGNTVEKVAVKPRYDFIDVLRIVACFFVIVTHTTGFVFLEETNPTATWFAAITWFFISKWSVPVFVMISGYTMLDRQDSYKKSFQRVWRMILVLCIFSLGYYMFQWLIGDRVTIGVIDFFLSVLHNPLSLAYWYIYMYIGLLIMMPFLQKLVSVLDKRDCEVIIGLSLLINGVWPILEHWCPELTATELFDFALFDSYVGMLMIGYYIKKYVVASKKLNVLATIGFVACVAFSVLMTYHEYILKGGNDYLVYDPCVYLPIILEGACVFYLASNISLNGIWLKIIKIVAGCTFGIFLISDFIMGVTQFVYRYLCIKGIPEIVSIFIYEIVIFMIGFVATLVMKKIPGLKKIM